MFGSKSTSEQQADSAKEQITKHLRQADEHFRFNRFEEALSQIEQALALDPKNFLARSFKERVIMLQKRTQTTAVPEKGHVLSEEEKQTIISRLLASAEEFIHAHNYPLALSRIAEVYKIDSQNAYAKAYSDRIEELQREQKSKAEKFFAVPSSGQKQQSSQAIRGAFFMYREMMKEAWMDGKVAPEEEQELKRVREMFNISTKEHTDIEREVKHNAYLEALRLAWRDGVLTTNERQVLEMMRQRYGITSDEHALLESQVQEAKKGTPPKATILVVDSDKDHRMSLFGFLKQHNYDVVSATNVEDALRKIVISFPHLILADIVFLPTQMDGFALFKKLQEHEALRNVPFFFMSTVRDEKIIRAAMRLGLDLFFTKPVDHELLLAAIEGRLQKR
jgi:CheY-like chemotaxis protein